MNLRHIIKSNSKRLIFTKYPTAIGYICIIALVAVILHTLDALALKMIDIQLIRLPNGIFQYGVSNLTTMNVIFGLFATVISLILKLILIAPLAIGLINWFLNIMEKSTRNNNDLFIAYEGRMFWRSTGLAIVLFIHGLFSFAFINAIPIALVYTSMYIFQSVGTGVYLNSIQTLSINLLLVVSAIIFIYGLYLWIVFMHRYSIAPLLICEKYNFSVHRAISTSVKYMKGNKRKMFNFKLSFIGWLIPLFLMLVASYSEILVPNGSIYSNPIVVITYIIAGFTFLLLTPYYIMSCTMYARYCLELGEKRRNGTLPDIPDVDADADELNWRSHIGAPDEFDYEKNAIADEIDSLPTELAEKKLSSVNEKIEAEIISKIGISEKYTSDESLSEEYSQHNADSIDPDADMNTNTPKDIKTSNTSYQGDVSDEASNLESVDTENNKDASSLEEASSSSTV